jgi:hypothetical protein
MERAGRNCRTLSPRTLRCTCLHRRFTRLEGFTQRAPHRHSRQATRLCLVPFVFVVLPRALPSVSRTHAIVRTVGSRAHSNNLSQSRTRRLRVRKCNRLFARSGVFGIAWAGSCLRQILPLVWSPGKTGVIGVGFWRPGKFWRCRCRGAVGMQQTATCELHRQIWRFGVLAWRGGDVLRASPPRCRTFANSCHVGHL